MKFKIAFIALLLIGLASVSFAQRGAPGPQRAHNPEMRKAMKTYARENVLPVLQSQRQKLDASLSLNEKREIESIRSELKKLRENGIALREQFHEGMTEPSETQRQAMYAHHKQQRQLMTRAWAIADANETEIQNLLAEIKPQAENWREEMKSIADQYRPEDAPQGPREARGKGMRPSPGGENMSPGGPGHRGHGMRAKGPMGIIHSPVKFLLWDPSQPLPEEDSMEQIRVFPNPGSTNNEVHLQLNEAGMVKINLLDRNGNLIRSLVNKQMEAGENIHKVDLQELEPGLYFYQIETPNGTRTRKIIVE